MHHSAVEAPIFKDTFTRTSKSFLYFAQRGAVSGGTPGCMSAAPSSTEAVHVEAPTEASGVVISCLNLFDSFSAMAYLDGSCRCFHAAKNKLFIVLNIALALVVQYTKSSSLRFLSRTA
jgi:hypothetical protein